MSTFILTIVILYILYAIMILKFFRNLMKSLEFTRKRDPNLSERFKPFERYDRQNWRMWEIYIGALTLLPIRALITTVLYIIAIIATLVIGYGVIDVWPQKKYNLIKKIISTLVKIKLFVCGFYFVEARRVKLTEYLPVDEVVYDQPTRIIISNHVSWWDSFILLQYCFPSYLAKDEVRRLPLIGYFASKFGSIFVKRNSKDDRDSVLSQLKKRCQIISEGKVISPVCIFPEATTTNGNYLLDFKKGAFDQGVPVKLLGLRYYDRYFNLALDNVGMVGVIIALTQIYNKCVLYDFEGLYQPKELLQSDFHETEGWRKFAQKSHEIISKTLGLSPTIAQYADTWEYHFTLFPHLRRKIE